MCDGHLYVFPFQVYHGIKRLLGHVCFQEIKKSVARKIALPVEIYRESGIEVGIVLQQGYYELVVVAEVAKYGVVRSEFNEGAVGFFRWDFRGGLDQFAAHECGRAHHAVAMRTYDEAVAESVDGFNADTVQTYRLLECLGVVFCAGIHL